MRAAHDIRTRTVDTVTLTGSGGTITPTCCCTVLRITTILSLHASILRASIRPVMVLLMVLLELLVLLVLLVRRRTMHGVRRRRWERRHDLTNVTIRLHDLNRLQMVLMRGVLMRLLMRMLMRVRQGRVLIARLSDNGSRSRARHRC